MQISPLLLMVAIFAWFGVFLLRAIRLDHSSFSAFELKRRSEQGDGDAQQAVVRESYLHRIATLRYILATLLEVSAVVLTVAAFGWLLGTAIAVIISILCRAIVRSKHVVRIAMNLYVPYEARLGGIVDTWSWLGWLKEGYQYDENKQAASKEELRHIIDQSAAVLTHDEHRRLQASLTLDNHAVRDVMTPVSVVETADVNDSLGPLVLDDLHKTGHSRFPVVKGDIHHIVGILYLHDIINLKSAKQTVREAMDPRVHYIHEEQTLEHALHGFLRTHRHLFVVVNDYRETVGVVTLEDVLEALLGKKIIDEFDQFDDLRLVASSNPRKNNLPKGKTDI